MIPPDRQDRWGAKRHSEGALGARSVALFLLALMVSASPRLHLGALAFDKRLDVRLEDFFILVILVITAVSRSAWPRMHGVMSLIVALVSWAVVSTLIGVVAGWIEPVRAVFYITKELEYYLFFFVTLRCVRESAHLTALVRGIVVGALLNGGLVLYQFGTGQFFGREDNQYGVAIWGEYAAFNVSAYGAFVFLVGLGLLEVRGIKSKVAAASLAVIGGACLIGGVSRTVVACICLTGVVWMILLVRLLSTARVVRSYGLIVLLIGTVTTVYALIVQAEYRIASRVAPDAWTPESLQSSYQRSRVQSVYLAYLDVMSRHPVATVVTGLGKSITGTNLPIEAHNYWLRLLVEGGVIGLLLFACLMATFVRISYRCLVQAQDPRLRAPSLCALLYGCFLLFTTVAQDTFIAPRITELFWMTFAVVLRVDQWNAEARSGLMYRTGAARIPVRFAALAGWNWDGRYRRESGADGWDADDRLHTRGATTG